MIVTICEFIKSVVSEVYILIGQIFDTFLQSVLYCFFDFKDYFHSGLKEINVIYTEKAESFNVLLGKFFDRKGKEQIVESKTNQRTEKKIKFNSNKKGEKESTERDYEEDDERWKDSGMEEYFDLRIESSNTIKKLFKLVLKFILVIPYMTYQKIFRRKKLSAKNNNLINRKISYEEKKNTGLIEELFLKNLEFVDLIGESIKLFFKLKICKSIKTVGKAFKLYSIESLTSTTSYDQRSIAQIIREDYGFPVEELTLQTEDGYFVEMTRIVRKNSRKAIFFQHGILDSSFCWVQNDKSLAAKCYKKGYDIYLGNFRGFGGKMKHINPKIGKKYWDYTIDTLLEHDLRTFIEKIVEIKKEELKEVNPDIDLTLCAHSLGGAVSIGYIVNQIVKNRCHHLKRAVLLSPAGIHPDVKFFMTLLRYFVMTLNFFRIKFFGINNKRLRILFCKLFYEVVNNRASGTILYFLSSIATGGDSRIMSTLNWHNLINHVFFGCSCKLMNQFVHLAKSGNKFHAYDYGKKKNKILYGTEEPFNYSDHYKDIDIPITFVAGGIDTVINPVCIKAQYDLCMKNETGTKHKFKIFPEYGHMDMTYNILGDIILYVENAIYTKQ